MEQIKLGRTDCMVSRMGLGGLFLSSIGGDFARAKAVVDEAMAKNVNYIDTAPTYHDSETMVGNILKSMKNKPIISTKLGGRPEPFDPSNKELLLRSVDDSLNKLGLDRIDILMIHEPDRPLQYDWWKDHKIGQGPVIEVLEDLKKRGMIRYTGIGGTTAYQIVPLIETGVFDVLLTAFNYSLLWREAEHEVFDAAARQQMGVIAGSPLQQGALARRYDEQVRQKPAWLSLPRQRQFLALYDFLDQTGFDLPSLAMRFVISNPNIHCVLSGVGTKEQLIDNIASVEQGPLDKSTLAVLDDIAKMVPFRPFEEPFGLPFCRTYKGPGVAR